MSVRLSEMFVVADLVLNDVPVESGGAALPHQANVRTRIYLPLFAAERAYMLGVPRQGTFWAHLLQYGMIIIRSCGVHLSD